MHDLGIEVCHRGTDNVGGIVISADPPVWTQEVVEFMLADDYPRGSRDALRLGTVTKEQLIQLLHGWNQDDAHHSNDLAYNARERIQIQGSLPGSSRRNEERDSKSEENPTS
jgi:hypothetical protein